MALDMARDDPSVSPWEALLAGVSRAVARSLWVDAQLQDAVRAATTGEHDGADPSDSIQVRRWLKESRSERALMGRTAQAAIQAGVAERLVRQVQMEGRLLAAALDAALDSIELSADQRLRAVEAAHEHLLGADAGPVVRGEIENPSPPATDDPETPDDGSPGVI